MEGRRDLQVRVATLCIAYNQSLWQPGNIGRD